MPKKKGGKKKPDDNEKRSLVYKDDMQEYGIMTKMLGDRRIMVMLVDKTEIMAIIPGKFRKRCWMKAGDTLIVSRRDFQESKWDVCYKYNEDEVRVMVRKDELPSFFLDTQTDNSGSIESYIEFNGENNLEEDVEVDVDDI
jgi:translation initiation factor 1A